MMLFGVTLVYLTLLVFATFMPSPASARDQWYWPVVAFVPVGVLLLLLLGRRRWWAAFAFSVLAAVWIETAQSAWMPAGYARLSDVAWSAAGAIIGVVIASMLTAPRSRLMRAHESHRVVSQAGSREIPQD
jgi:glycopeptide antibiotics resistance protein